MKQAWMLPIQPQWVDMIRSLVKGYEFRPYPLEGKVYIYESLGKKFKCIKEDCSNCRHSYWNGVDEHNGHWTCTIEEKDNKYGGRLGYAYKHEGAGAIVGEFVVEECVYSEDLVNRITNEQKDIQRSCCVEGYRFGEIAEQEVEKIVIEEFEDIGWNSDKPQKYAIKISQLKFYDKPIPKEEFVSWSKYNNHIKGMCDIKCEQCDYNGECTIINEALDFGKVTHAPQRAIKVVERLL